MRSVILVLFLVCWSGVVRAAPGDFAWVQHPGAPVPSDGGLRSDTGQETSLALLAGSGPIILDLGYFHCPSLCGVARGDIYAAIDHAGLTPGQDVTLVSVSIDPGETPADAARAAAADLQSFPRRWARGVHYATGSGETVAGLSRAVGFHAEWDASLKQFMHPAGIVILTHDLVVSSYLLGVGYTGGDLRAAVLRAGQGGIAEAALPILLLCFHFDSTTGRYTLEVMKVLRLMGGITVVAVVVFLVVLGRRKKAILSR